MQHIRVVCPADHTDDVLASFRGSTGVAHLMIYRGASVLPEGDVIEADIARECANDVLDDLHRLGVTHSGGVTLSPIETIVSERARKAEKDTPGDPDDAVIWDELMARTREESTLNLTFVAFLTIACLLSAVGVILDSPVTIVGAVVVGPEFGPLAALAVGLVRRKWSLAGRSVVALLVGFPFAMLVTAGGAAAWRLFGWVEYDTIDGLEQVDFIYQVGPFSLVVALLAGAAGMLAIVSAKSAALVGVFISVTTVPAAGFAVVAATVGNWRVALLSAGQLGINMVGIVAAASFVLALHRRSSRRSGRRRRAIGEGRL